jgi:tripartite-type tricarboxylate transporter receptor subunit TctC
MTRNFRSIKKVFVGLGLAGVLSLVGGLAARVAWAQQGSSPYPSKAITIIVPFPAGGNTDVKTRMVAQQLSAILGQPVIVDNRPGASGNIGMELLARATPDGYTIGMGSFGPLAVNQWIYPKMKFSPDSVVPIILLEKSPLVLVTPASKVFRSLDDVISTAKKLPGSLNIANAGPGGAHHLSAELFESAAGISMVGIPFKGGGPAALALMAGQVDLMFEQTGAAMPSIRAGKIRAIAVTSAARLPNLSDVPTFSELGFPQVTVSNWMGYVAPKGLPPSVLRKLQDAFATAIARPEVRQNILAQNNEFGGGSSEDFAAFIASEAQRWGKLIKERGITIE